MATLAPAIIAWKAVRPSWFRPDPGFRFFDPDGDQIIVIGEGGWRQANPVPIKLQIGKGEPRYISNCFELEFKPWTLVGSYNYKGEWHLIDLADQDQSWWDRCHPF